MENASICCSRSYSLFPGFVIAGGLFSVTVIVNVAVTSSLAPSFAVTVTV